MLEKKSLQSVCKQKGQPHRRPPFRNNVQKNETKDATQSVEIPRNNSEYAVEFVVIEDRFTPILGAKAAQKMDLVVVQRHNILHSNNATSDVNQPTEDQDIHRLTEEKIMSQYADLFSGLGKIKGKLHLDVDRSVVRVVMPPRRITITVEANFREELDRLERLEVNLTLSLPKGSPLTSKIVWRDTE